ncbi:ricin-type beta-trefoil lectin domain protein [Streptomyces sp. NBC_00536]|uniref:ricin-type beta-trefoil lectin domain protein n=1 Tax=Streptomyces sp. NBC_00536 TaxID=2975769 RepID=UPI002E809129|nr:ricin-type beta-trefoil lectin domain protein [Streptomyces sp. NBC_00536]WUC83263.1 ricin-type beta-trefoil lectin domain protein [Streptomyces sp. NBC_00536]
MASPAVAAPEGSEAATALIQLTFTNVSNGKLLDVQDGSYDDSAPISVNPAPGSATTWRINTGTSLGSGFAIVNNTTGKCMDLTTARYQLRQQPCDGRASEQWYFQPIAGSAQKAFRIRQVGDNSCLTVQIPPSTDNWVYTYRCDNTPYQQWTLPAAVYQTAWNAAVDYAAGRCNKDTATCVWSTTSQTPPFTLPETCVSPIWFNDTSTTIPWEFTLNTSTGWSNSIGVKLGGSLAAEGTIGVAKLTLTVSAEVSGQTTVDLKQEMGNKLTVSVPPRQYGWVTLSELATKATGTWTFDAQGFPWTADDTITVPLKYDVNGGASIYSARTRATFTNCAGT